MKTQTVRFSGVPFKITKLKRSRGGVEWRLRWYDTSGKRQSKTYKSEADARLAASDIRFALQNGIDLQREATNSGQLLEDHRLVIQLTKYCPRAHLLGAALAWGRSRGMIEQKTVLEVCQEFLSLKKSDKVSTRYIQDLEYRLPRIWHAFPDRPFQAVTGKELDGFLAHLNLSQRSLYNFRLTVSALAGFARKRGYVSKDWSAVEDMALTGEKRIMP